MFRRLYSCVALATAAATLWLALGATSASGAPPANDAFSAAQAITGTTGAFAGTMADATSEAGEPLLMRWSTGMTRRTVWFRWTAPASGPTTLTTCSPLNAWGATSLGVYTGTRIDALTRVMASDVARGGTYGDHCPSGQMGDGLNFQATSGTTYRIVLEVSSEFAESNEFTLQLNPPPANDTLADAKQLSAWSPPVSFNTDRATADVGEPMHGGVASTKTLWYRYGASGSNRPVVISACESTYDTVVAVYRQTGSGYTGLVPVASSDDAADCGAGSKQSAVRFTPDWSATYYVAVSGHGSIGGTGLIASGPDNDAVESPYQLSDGQTVETGAATTQPGEPAIGGSTSRSVWFTLSATPAARTVIIDTCTFHEGGQPATDTVLGVYRFEGTATPANLTAVATNDDTTGCGPSGKGSRVRVTTEAGREYRVLVGAKPGKTGLAQLRFATHDDAAEAQQIWPDGSPHDVRNGGATAESGEPARDGRAPGASVWYEVELSREATYTFDTCTTDFDTVIGVYTRTGPGMAGLQQVSADDDDASCANPKGSRTTFRPTAATTGTYYVTVDGAAGATGRALLSIVSNDARRDAITIEDPTTGWATATMTGLSRESGEPTHGTRPTTKSGWFRFTVPHRRGVTFSSYCRWNPWTTEPQSPPTLALYSEGTGGTLTAVGASTPSTDPSQRCSLPPLTAVLVPGTEYFLAVATGDDVVTAEVTVEPAPLNDLFADADPLPAAGESAASSNHGATREPGEPTHAGVTTDASMWWQYAATTTGRVTLDVCGRWTSAADPLDDSVLAVYEGTALNTLTPVASNDDASVTGCSAPSAKMSRVGFDAVAGRNYRIVVAGKGDAEGGFLLRRQGAPSNDNRAQGAYISELSPATGTTAMATAEVDEPAHAGTAAAHSVWYRPSVSPGLYEVTTCAASSAPTRLAAYSSPSGTTPLASATPSAGCAEGRGSTMTVRASTFGTLDIAVDSTAGAGADFTITLRRLLTTPNDDLAAASQVSAADYTLTGQTTAPATREPSEPDHAGAGGTASVWFQLGNHAGSKSVTVEFDTCSASFDTALAVYERTGAGFAGLTPVQSNDDTAGCGTDGKGSRLRFSQKPNVTYLIAVDGHGSAKGTFSLAQRRQPSNDDFTTNSGWYPVLDHTGSTRLATAEAGEPAHAGAAASASVWFMVSPRSRIRLDTCSSSFDTRVAVYRGTSLGGLTEVASNDDAPGCGTGGSRIEVATGTTQPLLIALDGKGGASGDYRLRVAPGNDDVADAEALTGERPTIWSILGQATAQSGEPDHAGSAAAHSVWYRWTAPRTGEVVLRTCRPGNDSIRGQLYTGTGLTDLAPAARQPGTTCPSTQPGVDHRYTVTSGTTYLLAIDQTTPTTSPFGYIGVLFGMPPLHDARADAVTLTTNRTFYDYTDLAGRESSEPDHGEDGGSGSIWYRHTAAETRNAIVSACFSSFDTVLAVYEEGSGGALTRVAGNDDADGCGSRSRVRWRMTKGKTYLVALAGKRGASGASQVTFALAPPNDDVAQSTEVTSGTVLYGETLTDAAREDGEPTYPSFGTATVWYRLTAQRTGPIIVNTCGSATQTLLAAYRGAVGAFERLALDGDGARCGGGDAGSRIQFEATEGVVYHLAVANQDSQTGPFTLRVDPPANDAFEDARALSGARSSVTARTAAAGAQRGEPNASSWFQSLWYRWTAPATGTFELNTCGSGATLGVFTGTALSALTPRGATVTRGCWGSAISLAATAGTTYVIQVADSYQVRLQINPPSNDRPADAEALTGLQDTKTGTTTGASTDNDETSIADGRSVWYRWTAPDPGEVLVDACTSDAPVEVVVYRRATNGTLTAPSAGTQPTTCPTGDRGARTSFMAVKDAVYIIGVDGTTAETGAFTLRLDALLDTDPPETTIGTSPPDLTNASSVSFAFSSDETGSTFECATDGGGFSTCTSPRAISPAEGARVFAVRARDRAGNVDPTPAERRYTVDRTPPTVVIDTEPPGTTAARVVSAAFHASETGSTFACSTDGAAFAPCTSPYTTPDLSAEGAHTVRIRATDGAGNTGPTTDRTVVVDRIPPETTITGRPADVLRADEVQYRFASSEAGDRFECRLDDAAFATCPSPKTLTGLSEGEHTFDVRAVDPAGTRDPSPASHTFEIDRTPPETTITSAPTGPVHGVPEFGFSSTEGGTFQCQIDDRAWEPCRTSTLEDLAPGDYHFRVRAVDEAGNIDPTPPSRAFTIANQAPRASIVVTPEAGQAPLDVEVAITGQDADADPLGYSIDWGEGGSATDGALPRSAPAEHRYAKAGTYVIRVTVEDGWESDVVTETVRVAPPEPLDARAGDDRTGAAGDPVRFDAGNSRPLAGIEGYRWDFGDGSSSTDATTTHAYANPGTYEAKLTVTRDGEQDTDTVTVRVLPAGPAGLRVTVTSGGSPVTGADALVVTPEGERIQAVTDAQGRARLRGLADGTYSVAVYAPDHLPTRVTGTVRNGSGDATVALQRGALAEAKVTSKPMTLEEILAAGIDPNDPANQHVYQFTVNLQLTPDSPPHTFTGGLGASGGGAVYGIGGLTCRSRRVCWGTAGGTTFYVQPHVVEGKPLLTTLVIPFKASWLKEFFDVSMTISNLAAPGFTLTNGSATLELPSGLALAPTAKPQSVTQAVADIPGGGEATARWILRGDREGEYTFGADYAAVIDPIGRSFALRAELEDPLKVWGGSALKLIVEVDEAARDRYPYTTRVGLKNVADVPVYNPAVELLKEGRHGYIEQPRQQRAFATREIKPGETFWAGPFVIIPEASGTVDLSRSFLRKTAGDVDLEGEIVTRPRMPTFGQTPLMQTMTRSTGMVFTWEAVDGASAYEAYMTPDRETDFPDTPLPMQTVRPGVGYAPGVTLAAEPQSFAISTLGDSDRGMVHPLVTGAANGVGYPRTRANIASPCGSRPIDVDLTFNDPIFGLTQWEYRKKGDSAWRAGGTLTGHEAEATVRLTVPARQEDTYEFRVRNDTEGADRAGIWGPTEALDVGAPCRYVALGDSFSSGEGAPALDGDGEDYFESGTDQEGNGCHRSPAAYARLLDADDDLDIAIQGDRGFVACSGAVTADYWNKNSSNPLEDKPQRDALTVRPDIVTMTFGGNDMKFAQIVKECVIANIVTAILIKLNEPVPGCALKWHATYLSSRGPTIEKLEALYRDVKSKMRPRSDGKPPRLYVLGYPPLFPSFDFLDCLWFTSADSSWMQWAINDFNDRIKDAARAAGAIYVPPSPEFAGNESCAPGNQQLINSVTASPLVFSFHPNRKGHAAMKGSVKAAMQGRTEDYSFKIRPGEIIRRTINIAVPGTRLIAYVYWPGSTVGLELVSPSGRRISAGTTAADVTHDITPTQAGMTVEDAEPGAWTIEMTGTDVDPDGEPATLQTAAEAPPTPQAPVPLGTADTLSGPAALSVGFDGSTSFDPDGTIAAHLWDFGDGSAASNAVKPTHVYTRAGTFTPRLTVRDASGATATLQLDPVVVTEPTGAGPGPSTPGPTGPGPNTPGPTDPGPSLPGGGTTPATGPGTGGTSAGPRPLSQPFLRMALAKKISRSKVTGAGVAVRVYGTVAKAKITAQLRLKNARGRVIARAAATSRKAGELRLRLKPSKATAKRLKRGARLHVTVTGKARGLRTRSATATVTLK